MSTAAPRWTREESDRLLELTQGKKRIDWKWVADQLGKDVKVCRSKRDALVGKKIKTGWTLAEHDVLHRACTEFMREPDRPILWDVVAAELPKKTARLCQKRWEEFQANPTEPKRKRFRIWLKEEDGFLRKWGVEKAFERDPSRTLNAYECRYRYLL